MSSFARSPPPPLTHTDSLTTSLSVVDVAILIAVCLGVAVAVVCLLICCYRRKLRRRRDVEAALNLELIGVRASTSDNGNNLQQPNRSTTTNSEMIFSYEDLVKATDDFATTNLLGKGGFGYVQKGVLEDGTEVAVKHLKDGSGQGEREFQAEIQFISRVHHRHLVSLIGYCVSGSQRLLVYEFLPNKTLEFHLHEIGRPVMEWANRMKIALGSAKGLSYLHEDCKPRIIHRDIKAANILIDDAFEAKVADFGLARSAVDADSHVSTRVVGTFGYLAPDYATSGKLSDKSDVFSFGVVLLELITGRKPLVKSRSPDDDDFAILVDWAKPLMLQALSNGNFEALADPRLLKMYDVSEMRRVVACASASVRPSARDRPKMIQIVRALQGISGRGVEL